MNDISPREQENLLAALIGDGRSLLSLTGLALIASGAFALFLSATGSFLPHDVDFLGMQPRQLCGFNQCRIVHFMFHDRVAFGGVLIAIGIFYLWLAQFPLKHGEEWSWWVFFISGAMGFASFLSYLGYGYLDTWHGVATLVLLPCFVLGMWKTHALLPLPRLGLRSLFGPVTPLVWNRWKNRAGFARMCLLFAGCGMAAAGSVIMFVGMSSVFVPQDLQYLGVKSAQLAAINPHLVPLIAHDRAGFGGGLLSCGLMVVCIAWKAPITPALWQTLLIAGTTGFGCAIGVHFLIGYTDFTHITPAFIGALIFVFGIICAKPAAAFN
ncbi:MAG TPA: hypothetical protein VIT91_02935 [Chthoniobacterales bacterium]